MAQAASVVQAAGASSLPRPGPDLVQSSPVGLQMSAVGRGTQHAEHCNGQANREATRLCPKGLSP